LSQIVELVFVLALSYAFFLQRQTFTQAAELRGEKRRRLGRKSVNSALETTEETTSGQPGEAFVNDAARSAVKAQTVADEDDTLVPLGEDDDSEIEWSHRVPQSSRTAVSGSVAASPPLSCRKRVLTRSS
jgi:hypothetical protein